MGTSTIRGGFTITVSAGATLLAGAALFDAEPLYVPGLALLVAALGAVVWVLVGSAGTVVEREVAARRALEDEAVAVTVLVHPAITILPGTRLVDPLLREPLVLRPAAGSPTRWPSCAARCPASAMTTCCSSCRASSPSSPPGAGPRAGGASSGARPRARRRPTSTACARTAPGRPRRGSSGPRTRARGNCSSGAWRPSPTRAR